MITSAVFAVTVTSPSRRRFQLRGEPPDPGRGIQRVDRFRSVRYTSLSIRDIIGRTVMNILSLLSFTAFISYVYLGLRTWLRDRRSPLNRAMLIVCASIAIWALSYTFIYPSLGVETTVSWYRLSVIGWGTIPSVALYLFLLLTGYVRYLSRAMLLVVLVAPALACVVLANLLVVDPSIFRKVPGGWVAVFDITSPWIWIYVFYYCVWFGTGFIMLLVWARRTTLRREKKQARIIVGTVLVSLVLSSVFDNLFPVLGIVRFPMIAPIAILIWVTGTWYAIVRYRFMSLSTAVAADEIITRMQDLMILADPQGRILQVNPHALALLECKESDIAGRYVTEIMTAEHSGTSGGMAGSSKRSSGRHGVR